MACGNSGGLPRPLGDGTEWLILRLPLTNDLNTLSVCAKMVQPDGDYFHFKAEKLGAQRGDLTCSVAQHTTEASFRFRVWAISQSQAINDLGGVGRIHVETPKPLHSLGSAHPSLFSPPPQRVSAPGWVPFTVTSSPCHLSPGRDLWISLQGFSFNNNIYNHFRN